MRACSPTKGLLGPCTPRLGVLLRRRPSSAAAGRALAVVALAGGTGCAGLLGGAPDERSPATRAAEVIARSLAGAPCEAVALTADDPWLTLAPWLESVADTAAATLRARGLRVYRTRTPSLDGGWIALTRSPAPARLRIERRGPLGTERIAHLPLPRALAVPPPALPATLAGRRYVPGPTFPWAARAAWPGGPGRLWVETDVEALALDLSASDAALEVRVAERAAGAAAGPARAPAAAGRAFILEGAPPVLRDVPLLGVSRPASAGGAFVAVDAWGVLLYGDAHRLWGAPEPGFAGGVVHVDDRFVAGVAASPAGGPGLASFRLTRSRRLERVETLALGGAPLVAIAATDVDGDGRADLVMVREVASGTRVDVFATAALVASHPARAAGAGS